jgi:hypothetical protein
MPKDTYQQLANHCKSSGYRLLLNLDTHPHSNHPTELSTLEVRDQTELLVRVNLTDHTIHTAATVALNALKMSHA